MTADPAEAAGIDSGSAGPGWTRTGFSYPVFAALNPFDEKSLGRFFPFGAYEQAVAGRAIKFLAT